jgi:hypothetical protein
MGVRVHQAGCDCLARCVQQARFFPSKCGDDLLGLSGAKDAVTANGYRAVGDDTRVRLLLAFAGRIAIPGARKQFRRRMDNQRSFLLWHGINIPNRFAKKQAMGQTVKIKKRAAKPPFSLF